VLLKHLDPGLEELLVLKTEVDIELGKLLSHVAKLLL
jgi:hypothetical protein